MKTKRFDKAKYNKLPEDKKQYVEVLLEDVNHKFDILIEGHDVHSGEFKKVHQTLDAQTNILASHTEMVGSIMLDVETIKEDLEIIKGGVKRKVDAEEFLALERRVLLLEKQHRGTALTAHK